MGILDLFSLKGKTALVTGGSGLVGRQLVRALAEAGAKVFIASRNLPRLEAAAADFRAGGLDVQARLLDLGESASVFSLRQSFADEGQAIDVLVNNASIKMMSGWDDDSFAFSESMRINLGGLLTITRVFGADMALRKRGSIINIGSTSAMKMPVRGSGQGFYLPDYCCQKAALIQFSKLTASYFGPDQVRCNCISPTAVRSEHTPQIVVDSFKAKNMLGRMVGPTDLMGAVVFLASDASSFITGVNLPVDGGFTTV